MSYATYSYADEKHRLETDEGQRAVYEAMLEAQHLAKGNGLIPHDALARTINLGDSFGPPTVIDRLIECGYIQRADNGTDGISRSRWIYRWTARART